MAHGGLQGSLLELGLSSWSDAGEGSQTLVTTLNFIWALRFQKVVLIEKSSSLLCSEKGLTIDDCSALKIRTTSTFPRDSHKNGGWFPCLLASRKCQVSFLFFKTFLINGHLPYNHSLNKIIALIVLGILSFTLDRYKQGLTGKSDGQQGASGSTSSGTSVSRCPVQLKKSDRRWRASDQRKTITGRTPALQDQEVLPVAEKPRAELSNGQYPQDCISQTSG